MRVDRAGVVMQSRHMGWKRVIWPSIVAAALFAGVAAGLALGYSRWNKDGKPKPSRVTVIQHHAAQMPKGGTIVMGDSMVERQRLDDLCGPTLNAGLGNATVADIAPLLPELLREAGAKQVVFEIGTNDLAQGVSIGTFVDRYRALVRSAQPARVIVVGVPGLHDEANAALRKMSADEGASWVGGFRTEGLTTDGVHFNAAGSERWRAAVRPACNAR